MKVRRDGNEREIVLALKRVGARVWRVKIAEPAGFPDLVVLFRGRAHLLEVKTDAGELTEAQAELERLGYSHVVRDVMGALAAIGAVRAG